MDTLIKREIERSLIGEGSCNGSRIYCFLVTLIHDALCVHLRMHCSIQTSFSLVRDIDRKGTIALGTETAESYVNSNSIHAPFLETNFILESEINLEIIRVPRVTSVDYYEDELSSIIPSEFGETVTEICEESGAAELVERVDTWNESLDKAEKKNTKLKNDMKELQERLEHLLEEIVSTKEELDGKKSSGRVFEIPKLGLPKDGKWRREGPDENMMSQGGLRRSDSTSSITCQPDEESKDLPCVEDFPSNPGLPSPADSDKLGAPIPCFMQLRSSADFFGEDIDKVIKSILNCDALTDVLNESDENNGSPSTSREGSNCVGDGDIDEGSYSAAVDLDPTSVAMQSARDICILSMSQRQQDIQTSPPDVPKNAKEEVEAMKSARSIYEVADQCPDCSESDFGKRDDFQNEDADQGGSCCFGLEALFDLDLASYSPKACSDLVRNDTKEDSFDLDLLFESVSDVEYPQSLDEPSASEDVTDSESEETLISPFGEMEDDSEMREIRKELLDELDFSDNDSEIMMNPRSVLQSIEECLEEDEEIDDECPCDSSNDQRTKSKKKRLTKLRSLLSSRFSLKRSDSIGSRLKKMRKWAGDKTRKVVSLLVRSRTSSNKQRQ